MKKYSDLEFVNLLQKIPFPNYNDFDNINTAYSDFINKLEMAIDKIAPLKKICVKNKTAEWIDVEIPNGIKKRNKLFIKFKAYSLTQKFYDLIITILELNLQL